MSSTDGATPPRGGGIAIGLGVATALVYLATVTAGDLRAHPVRFLVGAGAASMLFAGATLALLRGGGRRRLFVVLAGAVLFRAIWLPTVPSLSDDVWRYLWDGRVAAAGIDPFLHPPDAPELEALRDDLWERVNHRHVATIYPPAAQMLFRAADALGGLPAWKLLVLGCDGLTLAAILRMLRRDGRDPALAILYAWNPLVVIELAGSAHVDAAAIAASAWALAWLREGRDGRAMALLTVAAAVKVYPVVLLPLFAARVRDRRAWAVPLVVGGLLAAPYAEAGVRALSSGGLRTYAAHWEFNAPLFEALRALTGSPDATRMALGCAVLAFALGTAWRARRSVDPAPTTLATLGALLVASPTLHPWYVTWLVPFVAVSTAGPRVAWGVLSQTVLLSYAVLLPYGASGEWRLPAWVPWLEWTPFYAMLAVELARGRGAARAPTPEETGR